ncbi:MAG: isoprenylcysteine carboxylmethyltransferase family protein [Xenococcus sp. (in: cyanobacteria)]
MNNKLELLLKELIMFLIFHRLKKFLLENTNKFLGVFLSTICIIKIYGLWQYGILVQQEFSQNSFYIPSQLILNNLVHILYLAIASGILLLAHKPKRRYSQTTPTLISLLGSFLPYVLLLSPEAELLFPSSIIFSPMFESLIIPIILVFLGGIISLLGLLSLRKSFSITPEVRGLVVSGLYSFIRHPMYLGGFVSVGGIVLISLNIFSVVIYLLWLIIQIWRSRLEEKLLLKEYPNYEKYRRRTPAFLPIPKRRR